MRTMSWIDQGVDGGWCGGLGGSEMNTSAPVPSASSAVGRGPGLSGMLRVARARRNRGGAPMMHE